MGLAATLALLAAACRPAPATSEAVPDIPVYPGAQFSWRSPDEPDRDPTEGFRIPRAAAAEVQAWYDREMASRGWQASPDEPGEVTLYTDARGCWGFVAVVQDGEDVRLQISQQRPGTPCMVVPTLDPGED